MLKQIEDALNKIGKVCNNLQKAGDVKNFMILVQAAQNLMRLHKKLEYAVRVKPKSRKKILEKARIILGEKLGLKIPVTGILRG